MGVASCKDYQYLVFILGEDEYLIPVRRIKEIVGYIPVTPFAKMQGIFDGAIEWRDLPVPVVDLRVTISQSSARITPQTCILIVELPVEKELLTAGLVVDGVCEVIEAPADHATHEKFLANNNFSWGSYSDRLSSIFIQR